MSRILSGCIPIMSARSVSLTPAIENVYFSKSRTAITRKPMFVKRQVFENAMQKKIYRDAVQHHPYPVTRCFWSRANFAPPASTRHLFYFQNQRAVNRLTKYYVHHGTAKRQWDYETNMTHMRRNITQDMRLKAACKPHTSLDRVRVVKNIQMAGSALNSDMLVNLALHEPRTFKVIKRDFNGLFRKNWRDK